MKSIGMATAGSDMVVKYLPSGDSIGEVSLAVRLNKKDGDGKYMTQWYKCALFGKRAESLAQYITKGSKHCFTLSDIVAREYTTKDGKHGVSLEARIDDVELGGKSESQPAQQPKQQRSAPAQQSGGSFDNFDDSIQF